MSDINTSDEIVFFNELKIVIIIDIERIRANTAEIINFFSWNYLFKLVFHGTNDFIRIIHFTWTMIANNIIALVT